MLSAIFPALLALSTLGAEDPCPLFDGTTMDGWERFGDRNPDAWRVEDGCIVVEGKGGGWIGTDRDYDDFALSLQFKLIEPGSNSGIYLRAPAESSHISRTGMEIQILDDEHPRYATIEPWQRCGSLYHVAAAEPGHLNPPGEWNTMEIEADGPRVVIRLNGATVVDDRIDQHPELEEEHPGLSRSAGRIGLQCHDGTVAFRALQIRSLSTPAD